MKTLSRQIGHRIKSLRLGLNFSQAQLAKELCVSNRAISSYELGDSSPSLKNLIRIARLTHVSIDWLLTGSTMENQKAPENEEISEDEIRLLISYRRASRPRKRIILQISETLSLRNRKQSEEQQNS